MERLLQRISLVFVTIVVLLSAFMLVAPAAYAVSDTDDAGVQCDVSSSTAENEPSGAKSAAKDADDADDAADSAASSIQQDSPAAQDASEGGADATNGANPSPAPETSTVDDSDSSSQPSVSGDTGGASNEEAGSQGNTETVADDTSACNPSLAETPAPPDEEAPAALSGESASSFVPGDEEQSPQQENVASALSAETRQTQETPLSSPTQEQVTSTSASKLVQEEMSVPSTKTQAYAKFDSATGTLIFFRADGTVEATTGLTMYSGFENAAFRSNTIPWRSVASKAKSIMFQDAIAPLNMDYWFYGFVNVAGIQGLDLIDTSNTTSMKALFQNCKSLTRLDLSSWDVSRVTNMDQLFAGCTSLESVNTATWHTPALVSLNLAFSHTAIEKLDLRHFDTSGVTSFSQTFAYSPSLTTVDLRGWDTASATTFAGMFEHCASLTDIYGLEGFDTSNARYFYSMFQDAPLLSYLDLSSFDTSEAMSLANMFANCNGLTTVVLGTGWHPQAPAAVTYARTPAAARFAESNTSIRALLNGTMWRNVSTGQLATPEQLRDDFTSAWAGVWTQSGQLTAILYGDGTLVFQHEQATDDADVVASWVDFILNWESYSDRSEAPWLAYADGIRAVVFADDFETPFLDEWFLNCRNLASVQGMEHVKLMPVLGRMPGSASNDPRDWAYGSMNGMFEGCASLASIDLSGFDAVNVVNAMHLFTNCTSLRWANLSGWNVQNLSNVASMFESCRSLVAVAIDWSYAPNLLRTYRMFRDCASLTSIDLSLLDAPALIMAHDMFEGCKSLSFITVAPCVPAPMLTPILPEDEFLAEPEATYTLQAKASGALSAGGAGGAHAVAFAAAALQSASVDVVESAREILDEVSPLAGLYTASEHDFAVPQVQAVTAHAESAALDLNTVRATRALAFSWRNAPVSGAASSQTVAPMFVAAAASGAQAGLHIASILPLVQLAALNNVAFMARSEVFAQCVTMNRRTLYEARIGDGHCAISTGIPFLLPLSALPWLSAFAPASHTLQAMAMKPQSRSQIRPWNNPLITWLQTMRQQATNSTTTS